MKHLLRTASHNNDVCVIDDISGGKIIKVATGQHGVQCLEKEKNGLEWYEQQLTCSSSKENLQEYMSVSDDYARLEIKKFTGKKTSYKNPLSENRVYLERCIKHYCEIWPKEQNVFVHGDLTLDNVMFSENDVRFFDWEHSTKEEHPWGFDILYCMLSALLLPLKEDQLPSKDEYKIFMELLFRLFEHGLSAELAEYPLQNYRKIFSNNSCWANIVERSPQKLFPLAYSELYVDIIDDQITRRIRHKRYDDYKKSLQK